MSFKRAGKTALALSSLAFAVGLLTASPSFAVHQTVTGLTTGNQLVQFAVGAPQTLISGPLPVTGVAGDLVGIDYRPQTNTLYGVNDTGQVYLITPTPATAGAGPSEPAASWAATPIGAPGPTDPANAATGLDFNPVPDAIRINNEADENFRFSPNTGAALGTDTPLAFDGTDPNAGDPPAVGAAAYTNSFAGAPTTTLFDIDAGNDALVRQGGANVPPGTPSPNLGQLFTIGGLGASAGDITSIAGLDIEPFTNNTPYAALQTTGDAGSRFYRLNLSSGAAGAALGTGSPFIGGAASPQLVESVSLVPTSTASFVNAVTSVSESGGTASVTVTRLGPLNQVATINYATSSGAGDAATAGTDYTAASGTLTFAPGDASESLTVPITNDGADEADETLTVSLTMPSRSVNFPSAPPLTSKVNIVDNDDAQGKPGAPRGLISVPSQKIGKTIRAKFACDEACAAELDLRLGKTVLDSRSVDQKSDDDVNDVAFRLSAKEVMQAKKKAKGKNVAKFTVDGTFSDADGSSKSSVKFQLG